MTPQASLKIYGCLILAEVIYGVWPLVASLAIKRGANPVVFALCRCAGSAPLLMGMSLMMESHQFAKHPKQFDSLVSVMRDLPLKRLLLLGALMCTNFLGHTVGLSLTSSIQAALMQPLVPVLACVASVVQGVEPLNPWKLIGILVSVGGAMFVVYIGRTDAVSRGQGAVWQHFLGTLALIVNVVSTALYFVLQKIVLRKHPPIFITSISAWIATGYFLAFAVFYIREFKFSPWFFTAEAEGALVYAIFFTTTLNFVILAWANKATTPSTITAFSTLQPLITAVVGACWLGVYPQHRMLAGGMVIIGGLLLTVKAQVSETHDSDRRSEERTPLV